MHHPLDKMLCLISDACYERRIGSKKTRDRQLHPRVNVCACQQAFRDLYRDQDILVYNVMIVTLYFWEFFLFVFP